MTVDNLVMQNLKIDVQEGNVDIRHVRLANTEINTANDITVIGLFGPQLDKIHLNSTDGTIEARECRCSEFVISGKIVKVFNCFNSLNRIKATAETYIMNLLGCTSIEALGESTKISGLVGTLKALIGSRSNEIEVLMLQTNDNEIVFENPEGKSLLAFSNRMASKLTKILVTAKPEVITQAGDDIVLDRLEENLFEIVRNGENESTLKVNVVEAKELQLKKQSWWDTFSFMKKLFNSN